MKWENSCVHVCWHLGHLYTGTSDGKILHIHKGEIRTLATLGKPPCGSYQTVVSFHFLTEVLFILLLLKLAFHVIVFMDGCRPLYAHYTLATFHH